MTKEKCDSLLGRDIQITYKKPDQFLHSNADKTFQGQVVSLEGSGCKLKNWLSSKTIPIGSIIHSLKDNTLAAWKLLCRPGQIVFFEYLRESCDLKVRREKLEDCYREHLQRTVVIAQAQTDDIAFTADQNDIPWTRIRRVLSAEELKNELDQYMTHPRATEEELVRITGIPEDIVKESLETLPQRPSAADSGKTCDVAAKAVTDKVEELLKSGEATTSKTITDGRNDILAKLVHVSNLRLVAKYNLQGERTLEHFQTHLNCVNDLKRAREAHLAFEAWFVAKRARIEILVRKVAGGLWSVAGNTLYYGGTGLLCVVTLATVCI